MNETRMYLLELESKNEALKKEIAALREELTLLVDLNLELRSKLIEATKAFRRISE